MNYRLLLSLLPASFVSANAGPAWLGAPEIVRSPDADGTHIHGVVFADADEDGKLGSDEAGLANVLVTNGLDVVKTDAAGRYQLAVRPDMNVSVVQPSGWEVPMNAQRVPQFFYVHKEGGTPEELRFGGLSATGKAPAAINFPLRRTSGEASFRVAVIGDSQAYSNTEVGFFRDGVVTDLIKHGGEIDLMLYVGDVMGDDLGLLPRLLEIGSAVGAPQHLVHGNHDFDFDATSDAHSADSWRNLYGPQYYAFERGQVLFVILDNVVYPERAGARTYNGLVEATQMSWLRNLLAHVAPDRMVVFAHHIPFVSFYDATSTRHQTDNLAALHEMVADRPALSLSGHTHTIENLAPGESFAGWYEATGVKELPFRHLIAGAASGAWFQGDYDVFGVPMALQRMGAPKGALLLEFDGTSVTETYLGSGVGAEPAQWVDLNTPAFRDWFEAMMAWRAEDAETRDPVPPFSIQDLPDNRIVTPTDLENGVYLTANVWIGSRETAVLARTESGETWTLARSQAGVGEAAKVGAEWADPFAAKRQLSVARFGFQSRSGVERNQGYEAFRGSANGPAAPQPMGTVADRNMHLWRYQLPKDLAMGVHTIRLISTDRHGRETETPFVFEVRAERPAPRWRHDVWNK